MKIRHLFAPRPGEGRGGAVELLGWIFYGIGLLFAIAGVLSIFSGIAAHLALMFFSLFFVCRLLLYLLARR